MLDFHKSLSLLFLIVTLLSTFALEIPTAEFAANKLPDELYGASAIYDGDDSIYIFGGHAKLSESDKVFKFTISTEEIAQVGTMPNKGSYGTVQSDANGNVFYFGGYFDFTHDAVFKFDPNTNITTNETVLSHSVQYSSSVKVDNTVYILGSLGQSDILSFDMGTLNYSEVGNLPVTGVTYASTSVKVGDTAYIFNDGSSLGPELIVKVDLKTFESEVFETGLPGMKTEYPSSIYDREKYIYVIGGYKKDSGMETNGILRFDPETLQHDFMPVENFPVEGDIHFETAPAAVFVEKSKRIYLFGGRSIDPENPFEGRIHNDILYVQIDDLVPATITTSAPTTTIVTTTTLRTTTIQADSTTTKSTEGETTKITNKPTTVVSLKPDETTTPVNPSSTNQNTTPSSSHNLGGNQLMIITGIFLFLKLTL